MRRILAVLLLIPLALASAIHHRIRGDRTPTFAFLAHVAPSGHTRLPLSEGGGERTSFVEYGSFTSAVRRARLELRSEGWREVPLSERDQVVFVKGERTLRVLSGRLLSESHAPTGGALRWTRENGLVSVVEDRATSHAISRWAASLSRWTT